MCIEGVLGDKDGAHGFFPLVEGMRLCRALKAQYRLALLTVERTEEAVTQWLQLNGMTIPASYDELVVRDVTQDSLSEAGVRVEQVRRQRSRGFDVRLFVSADPEAVLRCTAGGVPGLFYAHPSFGWEGFRPDRRRLPKPWQDIEDEVTAQRLLRANDPRLSEEIET
jgi:hypothetical protein